MKEINLSGIRSVFTFAILSLTIGNAYSQTSLPVELSKNSMKEQLNYLEERTRIYENYRAIREDMFQKIKGNVTDTLSLAFNKIELLNTTKIKLNQTIDSLSTTLTETKTSLEDITRTKNSIKVLGIEVNKLTYNTLMWTIVGILIAILLLGFLIFKRNLILTLNTKKEFSELKEEFETYRRTTREAREKMSMAHFNELKKLRGE